MTRDPTDTRWKKKELSLDSIACLTGAAHQGLRRHPDEDVNTRMTTIALPVFCTGELKTAEFVPLKVYLFTLSNFEEMITVAVLKYIHVNLLCENCDNNI